MCVVSVFYPSTAADQSDPRSGISTGERLLPHITMLPWALVRGSRPLITMLPWACCLALVPRGGHRGQGPLEGSSHLDCVHRHTHRLLTLNVTIW